MIIEGREITLEEKFEQDGAMVIVRPSESLWTSEDVLFQGDKKWEIPAGDCRKLIAELNPEGHKLQASPSGFGAEVVIWGQEAYQKARQMGIGSSPINYIAH